MGPLTKRLKAMRSAVQGEVMRLQSGQYPFTARCCRGMDRNDPRHRATTVCDLTILGIPVAWGGGDGTASCGGGGKEGSNSYAATKQHRLVTVLGDVHSWTRPRMRSSTTISDDSTRCRDKDDAAAVRGLVWAIFTHDKAREQCLGKGTELRVYNAMGIPCDREHVLFEESIRSVQHMLLCTNLCEPYPSSVLPPLPDIAAVAASIVTTTHK